MDAMLFDLFLTYGLATLLVVVGCAGVAVLPWRSLQVKSSARAWSDLSVLSGGFAKERARAIGRTLARLGEASARRPSPALTRTLS